MVKDPDAGRDWGQEEKGTTEYKTVGWHHQLNGHEFEQVPGDGKESACISGDPGSIGGSERSPSVGNGNSL